MDKAFSGFGKFLHKAPYLSGGVIMLIGVYLGIHGLVHLLG
jgi:nickel/cobalt exporter